MEDLAPEICFSCIPSYVREYIVKTDDDQCFSVRTAPKSEMMPPNSAVAFKYDTMVSVPVAEYGAEYGYHSWRYDWSHHFPVTARPKIQSWCLGIFNRNLRSPDREKRSRTKMSSGPKIQRSQSCF